MHFLKLLWASLGGCAIQLCNATRSAEYALRSYLYLLVHALVAGPAALWLGAGSGALVPGASEAQRFQRAVPFLAWRLSGCTYQTYATRVMHCAAWHAGKVVLFYLVRAALGLLSAFTETLLVRLATNHHRSAAWPCMRIGSKKLLLCHIISYLLRDEDCLGEGQGASREGGAVTYSPLHPCIPPGRAVRDYAGARTAQLLLLLLATSAGMFAAATALLPSSFVMYFLTAAAAAVVAGRPLWVVAAGAVGVLLGWVVAGALQATPAFTAIARQAFTRLQSRPQNCAETRSSPESQGALKAAL